MFLLGYLQVDYKTTNHVEINKEITARGILEDGNLPASKIGKHGKSDMPARESRVKCFMDDTTIRLKQKIIKNKKQIYSFIHKR